MHQMPICLTHGIAVVCLHIYHLPWPFARTPPPSCSFALLFGGTSPVSQMPMCTSDDYRRCCWSFCAQLLIGHLFTPDPCHKQILSQLAHVCYTRTALTFPCPLIHIPFRHEDGWHTSKGGRGPKVTSRSAFTSQAVLEGPDCSILRESYCRLFGINCTVKNHTLLVYKLKSAHSVRWTIRPYELSSTSGQKSLPARKSN